MIFEKLHEYWSPKSTISHADGCPASGPHRLNLGLNQLTTFFVFCATITGNIGVLCNKNQ
jgi:hypothetical protein